MTACLQQCDEAVPQSLRISVMPPKMHLKESINGMEQVHCSTNGLSALGAVKTQQPLLLSSGSPRLLASQRMPSTAHSTWGCKCCCSRAWGGT
jgi:hypothetical protein